MPTYSYACTECDSRFDIVQSFAEDSLTVCQECAGKLRKLFSSVGIVFKGSGFYRNDSRAKTSSTAPSSDSGSAAEKKSGATTSGEKKTPTEKKTASAGASSSGSGSSSSGSKAAAS